MGGHRTGTGSPRLGSVVLYAVPRHRRRSRRKKWVLGAGPVAIVAAALMWWALSSGSGAAGPNARAATSFPRHASKPAHATHTAVPRATEGLTTVSMPPASRTAPGKPGAGQAPTGAFVTAARPGLAVVGLAGPRDRWGRAPSAGLAGIGKHVRVVTGEGSGPGWCLANGGYPYGANVDGVWACGPSLGLPQPFDTDGFQCVELSARFLWAVYGEVIRKVDSGADFVTIGHDKLHLPVGTPGPHRVPSPGDIVSLWGPNAEPAGHTAVVSAVNVNPHGNGAIQLMEENGSMSGWDHIDVRHWQETYGDPRYLSGYFYYTGIDWLDLARPNMAAPRVPHSTDQAYSVASLGSKTSLASSVSDSGSAAGVADLEDGQHAPLHRIAVFNHGRLRVLAPPHGYKYMTMGSGIDAQSALAGWGVHTGGDVHPYAVSPGARAHWARLLDRRGRWGTGQALAIDPTGRIAGWIRTSLPGSSLGALWTPTPAGYKLTVLRANRFFRLPMGLASDAYGDVVGTEMLGSRRTFAVVWTPNGIAHRLPSLYLHPEIDLAQAVVARQAGPTRILTVAGSSTAWGGRGRAVSWNVRIAGASAAVSRPAALPLPAGYTGSAATSINQSGLMVGTLSLGRTATRAFLYRPALGTAPISSLLPTGSPWIIVRASSINSSGQIAATGYRPGVGPAARPQGLLLTPAGR
jgi:hypothetical protein